MARSAPAAASATAQARPMPVAPPVTQATRPARNRSVASAMSVTAGDDESLGETEPERTQIIADGHKACPLPARESEHRAARCGNGPGFAGPRGCGGNLAEIGEILGCRLESATPAGHGEISGADEQAIDRGKPCDGGDIA